MCASVCYGKNKANQIQNGGQGAYEQLLRLLPCRLPPNCHVGKALPKISTFRPCIVVSAVCWLDLTFGFP